jgi:twitching motility protein PilT
MADHQSELEQLVGQLNRGRQTSAPIAPAGADLTAFLRKAASERASDLLLVAGALPALRVQGSVRTMQAPALSDDDVRAMVLPLLTATEYASLQKDRALDLAFNVQELGRCRANIHFQRGTMAAAFRLLPREVPTLASLHLPETLSRIAALRQGLVLLTGPTGSGKTSTLAAIVDAINNTRACHIVTIEEPVEYQHSNRLSIVEQIEVGRDTPAFLTSLRSILRQSPDVILVGEMRDPETISTALTAAETGHLVLSTLHTNDTAQAISRILDSFPSSNQPQVRQQLSLALAAIIAQQLVPAAHGTGRFPALEVLIGTDAIRNLIRTGNDHQIRSQLTISRAAGMITMEQSLAELVRTGRVTRETAAAHCFRHDELLNMLG